MKRPLVLALMVGCALAARVSTTSSASETAMTAKGTFDVKVTPLPADDAPAGPFQRLMLAKQFHGDLEAESQGQMLAAATAVEGSAGYVALEHVTGTLGGRKGSFTMLHRGTMQGGNFNLDVTVVPDSGTDELVGLSGSMKIIIEGKDHSYQFDYTLGVK